MQLTNEANQRRKEIWLLKCKAGEHERKLNDSKRQDAKRLHKYKKFKKWLSSKKSGVLLKLLMMNKNRIIVDVLNCIEKVEILMWSHLLETKMHSFGTVIRKRFYFIWV